MKLYVLMALNYRQTVESISLTLIKQGLYQSQSSPFKLGTHLRNGVSLGGSLLLIDGETYNL